MRIFQVALQIDPRPRCVRHHPQRLFFQPRLPGHRTCTMPAMVSPQRFINPRHTAKRTGTFLPSQSFQQWRHIRTPCRQFVFQRSRHTPNNQHRSVLVWIPSTKKNVPFLLQMQTNFLSTQLRHTPTKIFQPHSRAAKRNDFKPMHVARRVHLQFNAALPSRNPQGVKKKATEFNFFLGFFFSINSESPKFLRQKIPEFFRELEFESRT